MLSHRTRSVSPLLAPWVEHLWLARGNLLAPWRNMILPDGAMELIINLGDPQKLCRSDDFKRTTTFRHSWISGQRTAPIVIDELGAVHLIGVRLKPGGAAAFLRLPLRELTGHVVELEPVLGRQIDFLREQMNAARNDHARFALLEGWLLGRVRAAQARPNRGVAYALEAIRSRENPRIGELAGEIGLSHIIWRSRPEFFARSIFYNPAAQPLVSLSR